MRSHVPVLLSAFAAGLLLATIPPLAAHHSFDAEFDRNQTVEITGTVAKVEWMNPHIWIYVDVKGADGKVARWQFEGGAPNMLKRNGWKRTTLKEGDTVSIDGWRAKDGSNTGNARAVMLADGTSLFTGSSGGNNKNK